MSKKLFVGGLSWSTTDDRLKKAFEDYGTVRDAKVITDHDTGRSRGFGFITFSEAAGARSAIREMNGASLDGRLIRVSEARDRSQSDGDINRTRYSSGSFRRPSGSYNTGKR